MNKFNLNFLDNNSAIDLKHINKWFTNEFKKKGSTAQGVGWRDPKTQDLRYNALLDIFNDVHKEVSVLEVGCAYGHIVPTLKAKLGSYLKSYKGLDINSLAISKADYIYTNDHKISFEAKGEIESHADFIIASGLFGFKGENNERAWERYVEKTLDEFYKWGRYGFAVNFLSDNSATYDKRFYYANPSTIFRICQEKYGYKVILNHSYLQNDFTIIVTRLR